MTWAVNQNTRTVVTNIYTQNHNGFTLVLSREAYQSDALSRFTFVVVLVEAFTISSHLVPGIVHDDNVRDGLESARTVGGDGTSDSTHKARLSVPAP